MALIEDEDTVLAIDGQRTLLLEQDVEFLQRGYHDLVVLLLQVVAQGSGVDAAIDAVGLETLILLHGLIVEVFAVYHEKHLVHEVKLGG